MNVDVPVPVWKVPPALAVMCKFLFEATVTSPFKPTAPVAVAKVETEAPVTSCCTMLPFSVVTAAPPLAVSPTVKEPYKVVAPADPAEPTVKVLVPDTAVFPARVTAPLPVVNVLVPEITRFPFTVAVPVPVVNVPDPVAIAKFLAAAIVV